MFGIYKFVVDEDYENIIYYAYLCGVDFESVPRDSFSDMKVDGGLRYSVSFKAAFVEDMTPEIIYDSNNDSLDGRWATVPIIELARKSNYAPGVWLGPNNMDHHYKLKWRI